MAFVAVGSTRAYDSSSTLKSPCSKYYSSFSGLLGRIVLNTSTLTSMVTLDAVLMYFFLG